jgi:homotetrameric NADPH-dependent glutamate synthase
MNRILRREALSDSTFLWELQAEEIARASRSGQFVIVRLHDGGERIPLTIADFDPVRGTVTVVVQVAGRTTREMCDKYREGDEIRDLVGPLGLAGEVAKFGRVVLVGGGLGVAPLYPQARALRDAGNRVTAILGFRSADRLFWVERFEALCEETIVCTEDGSRGRKGLVTAALAERVEKSPPDRVIAIGPVPMMRACAEVTRARAIPTVASLNSIMVDGTGMCGSCRVTVGGEVRFACVDGPEFDAHAVDFAGMQRRQGRFRTEERRASEDYDHVCRLETALFTEGRRNYKKIRELAPTRTPMGERDPVTRARDFEEVALGYRPEEALLEAERCLQCVRPTCIAGCPVGIDIPRFIRHLLVRDFGGARAVIEEANLFPSICGRVCPQEHQCEAQCILVKKIEPVAIGRLERFVGDAAPPRAPRPSAAAATAMIGGAPLAGRVGIVGSGPAGLACAADLAKLGVKVTVFEALHEPGGVLRYGIPSFRLPRSVLDREIERLRGLGVEFRVNFVVGQVATVAELLEKQGFDALFVGTGAGAPAFLGIPGEDAPQVMSANEYLTRVHLMHADRFPQSGTPLNVGRRIAVVGAGNTAMDCLRTAIRLGANERGTEVHCVYRRTEAEAPARIEERIHAGQEGVRFHWLVSPTAIVLDDDGNVVGLSLQKMELGPPDASGRRRAVPVEGASETLPCDCVIVALGTRANVIVPRTTPGLATDAHGHILVDPETQGTSLRGVFAGGDIVTGAATVILAMGAGRRAAAGIARFLKSREWIGPAVVAAPKAAAAPVSRTCPRCRRPLEEGEGETICCATSTLAWRCEGCGKVSEGFAFPYGQCPACGGRLLRTAATPAVADDEQEAVRAAFEIELGGVAFYSEGAQQAIDSEVRTLFERLAAMEREHVETLARRYHLLAPDEKSLAMNAARAAVYAGAALAADDPALLLELAVALERKARDFFKARAAASAPGSRVAALLTELCAEEEEHVDLLKTELSRFRLGRAGLLA